MPGFVFELLVPLEKGGPCVLDVSGPQSVGRAVAVLRQQSSVDNTQARALVETLERQIALINGCVLISCICYLELILVCWGSNQVLSDLQVSPQGHGTQVRFRRNSLYYRTDGFGGVLSKVRWMNERPLGGMRWNEEHLQALQKFNQESSEEGSKQRVGGHGTVLEWMLERMDKEMTPLLQEAKRQDVAAEFSVI